MKWYYPSEVKLQRGDTAWGRSRYGESILSFGENGWTRSNGSSLEVLDQAARLLLDALGVTCLGCDRRMR